MTSSKKGLGKGLGALITTRDQEVKVGGKSGVTEIDINKIEPNREQPRKYFDEDSLMELAESFKEYGIIQPIIVKEEDGYYSIIAGERRWRAARIAKIKTIPVIIKDYTAAEILQIALIENIQRQDLNPIEEALCYKRLSEEYFFSQEDIAEKVGKSRNSVSYSMSLLNLDPRVQNFIVEGKITAGHGRHLLPPPPHKQFELTERIIEGGLSLRQLEAVVTLMTQLQKPSGNEKKPEDTQKFGHIENELKVIFGTKVNIRDGGKKGRIEIEYYSQDELDRLLGIIKGL